jgi:signal transduction histidine kinase
LGANLDLRARLFNVLAIGGIIISLLSAYWDIAGGSPLNSAICVVAAAVAVLLLSWTQRSGRYQTAYLLTITVVFLILFPVMFFSGHDYRGSMPMFFVFAVVFTISMLEGRRSIVMVVFEIAIYSAICLIAYNNPAGLRPYDSEFDRFLDIVITFVAVSCILGTCMFLHFRLYNEQQRKLDEQNRILESTNKMKTELFANVSHEMKTPLTIISVHIQRAEKLFEMARDGDDAKIRESFALAQEEIMRMSRLVNNALKLASASEAEKTRLDAVGILRAGIGTYETLLEKQGNALELNVSDDLPAVVGSADALVQILTNLLSNANNHTRNGVIRVSAVSNGDMLSVTVEDDGEGIPPENRSYVFERGVTDGGGSGFGLSICRDLVRNQGGDILLESELGKGTKVSFTLPIDKEENTDE